MNKLIDELKNDTVVKRYIYLRNIIESNGKYLDILKSDLSLNKAKTSNSYDESIINEYLECEKMVKNDIDLISSIINTGLNINFLD